MSKKIKSFISIFALTAMVFILLFTSENATFTVNAAKDNVVIVLDPGHGGTGDRNLGAQYNGISEKEITLKVANYAKAYLESFDNVTVYMTRTTDTVVSLEDRVKFAKSVNADFMYSIHFNASVDHDLCGSEVWVSAYDKYYENGYEFASAEVAELSKLGLYIRGIKTRLGNNGDYYGIIRHARNYDVNAVIIEHCYIDHPADLAWIRSQADPYQALGIADATAIAKYFGLKSSKLSIDYSNYKNVDVKTPTKVMANDLTAPTVCTLNSAVMNKSTGDITASITASDPETPIIYYRYSFDGGKNWSYVAAWDHSKTTNTVVIHDPSKSAASLTIQVYNQYDLKTTSSTISISK